MDLRDKKLITLLDENSREKSSNLAKKLKLSRHIIDYRINQLIKKRIINNFTTLIDPTKFYQNIWHLYVKLQNLNSKSENEIYNYLNNSKNIWWITKCQGEWDLIFSIIGNDPIDFDEKLTDFKSRFHNNINEITITSLIKAIRFSRGYFIKTNKISKEYIGKRSRVKIDKKDILILKAIAENSRMPETQIAKEIKLTPRQVIYRIKDLIKKEVIKGFKINISLKEINYNLYKVCFYTQNFTKNSEDSILRWCLQNPNTLFYVKKISPWTFEIEFEVNSYIELNNILKEIRSKFGNMIKRTETTLITEENKGELNFIKYV